MRAIRVLARDALMEMAKRKVLLAVFVAAVLTALLFATAVVLTPLVVQKMVENMTAGKSADPAQVAMLVRQLDAQGYNLIVSIFSAVIDILGTLLAIIIFSTFLPAEIERGSIKFVISKPVSRLDMVLGKFAAGGAVLIAYSVVTGALQMLGSLYLTGSLPADDLRVVPFLLLKLLVRGAVAMGLSMAMRPVLAGVLAFFISGDLFLLLAGFTGGGAHAVFLALAFLLPNYSIFPLRSFWGSVASAVGATVPPLTALDVAVRCAYALLYVAIVTALTVRAFNRKDLT